MKHTRLLIFTVIILNITFKNSMLAQCSSCTNNINGNSSADITVNGTKKYCFNSGIYTGNITGPSGGNSSICIMPGAQFNPSSISNWNGTIINYGTADVPQTGINGNAILENYGTWHSEGISMNGSHNELHNKNTGSIVISNDFTLPSNGSFTNEGDALFEGNFNQNGIFTNDGNTTIQGNFTANGEGQNSGTLNLKSDAVFNGNAAMENLCKMICFANLTCSGNFHNQGFFWLISGSYVNSGNISQSSNAQTRGIHFTNSGNMTGGGQYYFSGSTINSGNVGQDAANINFYDATLANPSNIFDNQSVVPHPSVGKNQFTPADSASWYSGGQANAGEDQVVCDTIANLNAVGTTGFWKLISGNGTISNPSQAATSVSNLGYGTNLFQWSAAAACGTASDYVQVLRIQEADTTIWKGAISDNWHQHQNWTKCIPGAGTFAIIESSIPHQPKIYTGKTGRALKVTLKTGAQLFISEQAQLRVNE